MTSQRSRYETVILWRLIVNAHRLFGWSQVVLGSALLLLTGYVHTVHSDSISDAFAQMEKLAGSAQAEIEVGKTVLQDVKGIAQELQGVIPLHRRTLLSASDASTKVAKSVAVWEAEIPRLRKTASDAQRVCDGLAENLPIRIPTVQMKNRTVSFEIPKFEMRSRKVEVPYPTAAVENGSRELSYPSGATVDMKTWEKSLGSLAGKSLGGLSFRYPAGLDITRKSFRLDYPKAIDIGRASMAIEVPANPKVEMETRKITVPAEPIVSFKEILRDEKKLLVQSSDQLDTLNESLGSTLGSLAIAKDLLASQTTQSIESTVSLLSSTEQKLVSFCDERIPTTVALLDLQKNQIGESRSTFAALQPLVGYALLAVAITGLAIVASGGAKLFSGSE